MMLRAVGLAVTILALVATGCAGSGPTANAPDPTSATSVASPGSSAPPSSAAPPEPLSKDAYQKLLTSSERTVRKALDQAMAAKSLQQLKASAKSLVTVARKESARFAAAVPPSGVRSNGDISSLLAAVDPDADPGKAKANECGIKPTKAEQLVTAKRRVLGSIPAEAVQGITADLKRAGYSWGGKLLPKQPSFPKKKKRRADNGEIIERNGRRGSHSLQITNDTEDDVVVAAVTKNPKKPMASIYVRANSSATLGRLAPKTYSVYYKTGTDWDDDRKTFTRGCSFEKFQLPFTPESNWRIELQKRIGGNAQTDPTEPF